MIVAFLHLIMSADIERQSAKIVQRYCYRADERWHQAIIDADTKLTFSAGLEVRADGYDRCSSTKTGLRKTRPKVNGARLNKETWVMSHNPPASPQLPPIAGVIAGAVALCLCRWPSRAGAPLSKRTSWRAPSLFLWRMDANALPRLLSGTGCNGC